jgi:hypothetical protein
MFGWVKALVRAIENALYAGEGVKKLEMHCPAVCDDVRDDLLRGFQHRSNVRTGQPGADFHDAVGKFAARVRGDIDNLRPIVARFFGQVVFFKRVF